jgi:hypothetical protein
MTNLKARITGDTLVELPVPRHCVGSMVHLVVGEAWRLLCSAVTLLYHP